MVICLPWIFLGNQKHLDSEGNVPFSSILPFFTHVWVLPFRMGNPPTGKPTAHPKPSLTLCSSRAAGLGTLAKNSCSKVVRSNSTSCAGGFRLQRCRHLEGFVSPIGFFVWGPAGKPAFFFLMGFVWGVQRWVQFHRLL